jgi:arylsulfatase A-like enzyme
VTPLARPGPLRTVAGGIAGGLLAGALVGVVEAVAAWMHAHGTGEMAAVAWAALVYGALGAAGGAGAGVVGLVLGTDGFALAFAGVLAGLGLVVARFRVIRDVFLEQAPRGLVPNVVQVAALAVTFLVAVWLWRRLRGTTARGALVTRPVAAAVVVLVVAAGWTAVTRLRPAPERPPSPARAAAPAGAPNVVLIMVDTLRGDHLGCAGYTRIRTPHIDALAADGIRFANAFSQASWTRPSVATILTGLYPSSHGAAHKADVLPDRVDTLAELLARGGYHTAGFANNANVSEVFNFQQGFDEFRYLAPELFFGASEQAAQLALYGGLRLVRERFFARRVDVRNYYHPAEDVTAEAVRWLEGRGDGASPFFLFLHYMDPHDPYMVHPFDGEGYARVANPNPPPAVAEKFRQLYDGEVAYLDQHLGTLFDDLRRRGLWEKTLVVLTADHGEEFHEHGGWWHGTTLYDEQIHVPLLMKPPGTAGGGRVVDDLATSLDIVPTVLATAGLAGPDVLQGHALPLGGGPVPARERVFSEEDLEGNVLQAVRTRDWKLVNANPGNPRGLAPEELYDLARDPREQTNVATQDPASLETMRATLGRSFVEARAHAGATQQTGGDAATTERLRSLGYIN